MLGGLDFDKIKTNVETHMIAVAIMLSMLALALVLVFILYVLGKHSTVLNIYLLVLVGLIGGFAGYILFA